MENVNENRLKQECRKKNFFVKFWWIFPIVNLICALLIIPAANHNLWGLSSALFIVFIVLLVIQGIIFIYCLCKKEWWRSVGAAIGVLVCFIAFYFISFIYLITSSLQPDPFGKEHPIPEGMECEIPLEGNAPVEVSVDGISEKAYLLVWNDFQGGLYQYSFYYPELPDGEVFLRCFEVTENIELSPSRLRKASTVKVIGHNGFGIIADKQHFTIYEGDWEDYYAARIEVWHKNSRTGEETKLLEKIYRVEGWMR